MKKMLRHIIVLAVTLMVSAAAAASLRWELVSPAPAAELAEDEHVEVLVDKGAVYITVNKPMPVKVLTIVGQIVAQDNLQPGTSRLKLSARGIYILKIGSATKRISI